MPATPFTPNNAPATALLAITPSDTVNFAAPARGIYVGGGGNIAVVDLQGNAVTLVGVVAGTILQVAALRVNATNTTATNLVALL